MQVSSLALGGWLTIGAALDDAGSMRVLKTALDGGITFLDLADVYADGEAERVVGRFLQDIDRDRLVISSKVFWPVGDSPNDRGLSRSHIHASIEGTLARLAVDHLDLYFCHREDPSVPLAETVRAMSDLCAQGKIRAWGTSCWRPSTLREAFHIAAAGGWTPPRVEQSQYSLMVREIENELVSCCRQLGMALVAFSPMAGGVLTGKYLDGVPSRSRAAESSWLDSFLQPEMVERVRSFVTWCGSTQQDPAAVALAWVMEQPGVASAICGASNVDQMTSNLLAADLVLDSATKERLSDCFPVGRRSLCGRILRLFKRLRNDR